LLLTFDPGFGPRFEVPRTVWRTVADTASPSWSAARPFPVTAATPVITVLDLGGGWLPGDLTLAGQCFGYAPPSITQTQGDGVAAPIGHADDETSLDLQTAAAVAPRAQLRLVQTTLAGILDGFSRALGDPGGVPDVLSVSFGGCALAENRDLPAYTSVINAVLAMTALTGVSSFVAAGDAGSTTCGTSVAGTTLSYPAVSPFVTAVGGTRLTLGPGNTRTAEVVWNDSAFGVSGAGGGGVARRQPRPAYQNGANPQPHRAIPDVSALADIVPGWPEVINATLQTVGGTSGSTPFVAAATALVAASERQAGRPPRAGQRLVLPGRRAPLGLLRHHPGQQRPGRRRLLPGHHRLRPRQRPGRAELGHPTRHPAQAGLTRRGHATWQPGHTAGRSARPAAPSPPR
jgi:hypothetical protein